MLIPESLSVCFVLFEARFVALLDAVFDPLDQPPETCGVGTLWFLIFWL